MPALQYVPTSPGSLTDELAPLQRPPKTAAQPQKPRNQETIELLNRMNNTPFDERRNDRKNRSNVD